MSTLWLDPIGKGHVPLENEIEVSDIPEQLAWPGAFHDLHPVTEGPCRSLLLPPSHQVQIEIFDPKNVVVELQPFTGSHGTCEPSTCRDGVEVPAVNRRASEAPG